MQFLTAIVSDKVVQANTVGLLGLTLLEVDTIVKILGGLALFVYTVVKTYKELYGNKSKDWRDTKQMG